MLLLATMLSSCGSLDFAPPARDLPATPHIVPASAPKPAPLAEGDDIRPYCQAMISWGNESDRRLGVARTNYTDLWKDLGG